MQHFFNSYKKSLKKLEYICFQFVKIPIECTRFLLECTDVEKDNYLSDLYNIRLHCEFQIRPMAWMNTLNISRHFVVFVAKICRGPRSVLQTKNLLNRSSG